MKTPLKEYVPEGYACESSRFTSRPVFDDDFHGSIHGAYTTSPGSSISRWGWARHLLQFILLSTNKIISPKAAVGTLLHRILSALAILAGGLDR